MPLDLEHATADIYIIAAVVSLPIEKSKIATGN
jgi:hypothetical protein